MRNIPVVQSLGRHRGDVTDAQWAILEPVLPMPTCRAGGRGRPWADRRAVFNGILWILRTGAPGADLPERYPSYQTCHRRFRQWVRSGVLQSILEALAQALHDEGYLDLRETFIEGASRQPSREEPASESRAERLH
jgi:transposase